MFTGNNGVASHSMPRAAKQAGRVSMQYMQYRASPRRIRRGARAKRVASRVDGANRPKREREQDL